MATLEKLPHLSAVIAKGLRLSYGVSSRTPRVSQEGLFVYRGEFKGQGKVEIVIPKETAIDSEHFTLYLRTISFSVLALKDSGLM